MPSKRNDLQPSKCLLPVARSETFADSARHSCAKSLVVLLSIVLVLISSEGCGTKTASAAAPPPPNVQVVAVAQQNVPIYHEYIATLDGYVNAVIQPQVSGYLVKQNYREGAVVRKNEALFNIDPRPFQAVLDQMKAQLAQAAAQLGKTRLIVLALSP